MSPPIRGSKAPSDTRPQPNTTTGPKVRKYRMMDYRAAVRVWEEERRRELEERRRYRKPRQPRPRIKGPVKQARFYVPIGFDLDVVPERLRWQAACALNLIHMKWAFKRARGGYARLNSHHARRLMPDWKEVKDRLLSCGVIECDGVFLKGKCYGFRLAPGYLEARLLFCPDEALNRRIQEVHAETSRPLTPVQRWLEGKLRLLVPDVEKADAVLAGLRPKVNAAEGARAYRQRIGGRWQRLVDGEHFLRPDRFGRIHTSLTAQKRELRACLRARVKRAGKDLVLPLHEIDVANCQPLLLALLAWQWHGGGRMARSRLRKRSFDGRQSPYRPQGLGGAEGPAGKRESLPADLQESLRVCEQGTFYESMMTPEELAGGGRYRERFKVRFYRLLFGRNRSRGQYPNVLRVRFRQRHPTLARALRDLKAKNYKHSCHLLQNLEATVIVHLVCGRVRMERPDTKLRTTALFTVHDAVMTTADDAAYVAGVVRDVFRNELGLEPTLKIKPPLPRGDRP
jgi:hypothetical protein